MKKVNILLILIIVLGAISAGLVFHSTKLADNTAAISIEKDSLQRELTKLGDSIVTQKQLVLTLKEAQKANLVTIQELKDKHVQDVSLIIQLNTEIKELKVIASYVEPADTIVQYVADGRPCLLLPAAFEYGKNDPWLKLKGNVLSTGVEITDLTLSDTTRIILGMSRKFFAKPNPIIVVYHTNRYIRTADMKNVIIKNKTPFYKKPNFYRLEGAAITYGLIRGFQAISK